MLDSNLTTIIVMGILALIPITIVSVVKLTNMRLKTEQIRADAMIKAEEIKAKNQYEIEKLLNGEHLHSKNNRMNTGMDDAYTDPYEKNKIRER